MTLLSSPLYRQKSLTEKAGFSGKREDKNGRTICYQNGKRVPCNALGGGKKKPPAKKPEKKPIETTVKEIKDLVASGQGTPEKLLGLISSHTVVELRRIQKDLGLSIKGNPLKAKRVEAIAQKAMESLAPPTVREDNKNKTSTEMVQEFQALLKNDSVIDELPTLAKEEKALWEKYHASKKPGDRAKWNKAYRKRNELQKKHIELNDKVRSKLLNDFKVDNPMGLNFKHSFKVGVNDTDFGFTPKTADEKDALNKASEFVKTLTTGLDLNLTLVRSSTRASYNNTANTLNVGLSADNAGVLIHELGHSIEYNKPGAMRLVNDFLEDRVGNEQPTDMAKFGMPGEMGRKDHFDRAFDESSAYYIGKIYTDELATEVLSMGIQKLYEDPATFMKKDPEYAALILEILRMPSQGTLEDTEPEAIPIEEEDNR